MKTFLPIGTDLGFVELHIPRNFSETIQKMQICRPIKNKEQEAWKHKKVNTALNEDVENSFCRAAF